MPKAGPEPQSASAEFLPYQYATTPWPPSSVPFDTASRRSNAFTTAPAGSTSILRRPPVMSFTFLAKSRAYSWKMSFVGQVDWKRRLIGTWATSIVGAAATTRTGGTDCRLLEERAPRGANGINLLVHDGLLLHGGSSGGRGEGERTRVEPAQIQRLDGGGGLDVGCPRVGARGTAIADTFAARCVERRVARANPGRRRYPRPSGLWPSWWQPGRGPGMMPRLIRGALAPGGTP